jgi:hypothetical protein
MPTQAERVGRCKHLHQATTSSVNFGYSVRHSDDGHLQNVASLTNYSSITSHAHNTLVQTVVTRGNWTGGHVKTQQCNSTQIKPHSQSPGNGSSKYVKETLSLKVAFTDGECVHFAACNSPDTLIPPNRRNKLCTSFKNGQDHSLFLFEGHITLTIF